LGFSFSLGTGDVLSGGGEFSNDGVEIGNGGFFSFLFFFNLGLEVFSDFIEFFDGLLERFSTET